jgi:hypothetical protein
MTQTIQTLPIVERLFPLILSGEKTSTIRWRELRIAPGPMLFYCDQDPNQTVEVEVFRCNDMPLSKAAAFVGKVDEWSDKIMLEGMREHYSEIRLSSIVQIIEYYPPILT